jgi:uncharacterized repeat protein (TIGR04042 family)
MPETYLHMRWPDGRTTQYYSPSSILLNYFDGGTSYPVPEFVRLARLAFDHASARVKEKFGYSCSRAAASLAAIEHYASGFTDQPEAAVTVLEISS